VDQILAEENVDNGADETVQWTLTDHLNTVRDIAKYNSGSDMTTVVNHLIYDAFGKVTSESNPAVDSLFLFTARPFDADTELQNNLNRWYDARVGRWLSEDPIGFAGGDGNLYRYVGNGVLSGVDSNGLERIFTYYGSGTLVHYGYGRTGGEHYLDYQWVVHWSIDDRGCLRWVGGPEVIHYNVRWGPESGSFSAILGLSIYDKVKVNYRIWNVASVDESGSCVGHDIILDVTFTWVQQRSVCIGIGFWQAGITCDVWGPVDVVMSSSDHEVVLLYTEPCCCYGQ